MAHKNIAGKGRKPTPSPGKPARNTPPKKQNVAPKSPAKKQWSKERGVATDTVKQKDPHFRNADKKARSLPVDGGRPVDPAEGRAAAPNQPPRPGSFKKYRKNYKNNKDDSAAKAGATPGKTTNGAKGEEGSKNAGSQAAKGKGNAQRDAFSKRQLGPAKPVRSERAGEEKTFDNKFERKPTTRQNKTAGAKPTDPRHKTAKRTKPADRKSSAHPAGKKRAPSKRRK